MHPKELFLGQSTTRTRLAITWAFSCPHPPGVGLDFLLQIHDRRSILLMRGACRDRQIHTPSVLPPGMLPSDRGAHRGRDPIFAFLGRGFQGGGCLGGGIASHEFRHRESSCASKNPGLSTRRIEAWPTQYLSPMPLFGVHGLRRLLGARWRPFGAFEAVRAVPGTSRGQRSRQTHAGGLQRAGGLAGRARFLPGGRK